jgi:outer membrane protein OmpA-like peptidoglycan-associated protein
MILLRLQPWSAAPTPWACAGGELIVIRAAGKGGVEAVPPVTLQVYREPGEVENDPLARQRRIQRLVDSAFLAARATPVPGAGRDFIGLLAAISADLGTASTDVWLRTFGLPTVAPADARILMAADPAEAAASIARWVPKLHGAWVRLILSPPAGNQSRLNTATDAWRRAFMLAVLGEAGAHVVSVREVQTIENPAPGAPPAPPVANLPEVTPRPPKPQPARPYRLPLDSSALFLPNSTAFAASSHQVRADLRPIIRAWRSGGYQRVVVVGHCARFGPPGGAVRLSRLRAQIIARMLRQAGVKNVIAIGVGYSQPLPPNPYSATNRVVIITAYPRT